MKIVKKKRKGWESIKNVDTGQISDGQRGGHTINSFGETLPKWESSMGLQKFFLLFEFSEEIFLLPNLSLCLSTCKMYSFTLRWGCSSYRDKGKVFLMIYTLPSGPCELFGPWLWGAWDRMFYRGLSPLLNLISLVAQFLAHIGKSWHLCSGNTWTYPGFISICCTWET